MLPLILTIDGQAASPGDVQEPLVRAVIISLFTWRRANPDDELPSTNKFGWWGDTYAQTNNDRIGSRLWLLSRAKLTAETVLKAKEYAEESLQWLIDDRAIASVQIQAERQGLERLALGIVLVRGDKASINIRFTDVWNYLNVI